MSAVPDEVAVGLRRICSSLPEIDEHDAGDRIAFKVGTRIVANVITVEAEPGPVTVMTVRGDEAEFEFLIETGHPFFRLGSGGPDRVGVVLDRATDWEEIGELVTDSYLAVAPKRLTKLLDPPES